MKIIDKEHKGLEQEIFNSKEYKKYNRLTSLLSIILKQV